MKLVVKLVVQGIEEIELTDPQGLCNPPVPQLPSPISPQIPTPFKPGPNPLPVIPSGWRTGDIVPEHKPYYTKHVNDPRAVGQVYATHEKWGLGAPMIQQAGGPDKWEKNWNGTIDGEANGNTHQNT